ncbi:MAG: hypothetical protein ACTSSP_01040 [Candidatus Asgardarchaeia archaeon]
MDSKIVVLDDMEQAIVKKVAQLRYESNRKAGVHDAKMGGQSNAITDIDGFGAELAFCKLCNLYPDFSIEPRKGGYDVLLDDNRIDIKQTSYKTGRLLGYIKKEKNDVDIYVLMVGELPTYTFVGWVYCNDLISEDNITDLGYGKTYALQQDDLNHSLEDLKQLSKVDEEDDFSWE